MPPEPTSILRRLLCVCVILFHLAGGRASATPWPHELGDVPPDPAIRWGQLDNGLRYAVRKNSEPAGRVSLVLQVAVGSIHERDDQRGYAHYIEHMTFRGTKRYPANSLVNLLQHEGLAMGADTSAFTNYTSTFYNLDLPTNSRAKISLGLSILRDFTDSVLFNKAEMKREAKVIASERRTRDSSASRVGDELTQFLHPGTLVTRRSPIGTPESVAAATPEQLREFYRTWYRPSRLTVIAVGDAEPDLLEALIRETFASLRAATPDEPADPDIGFSQDLPHDVQLRFIPTPSPGGTSTLLTSIARVEPAPDTVARRRTQLLENAGFAILSMRLAELQRQHPDEIGDSQASWSTEFGRRRLAQLRVDTRADRWRAGVRLVEQELRRALLHGFTADEVKLVTESCRNALEEAVRTEANRPSEEIAQVIRAGLENNFVNTAPTTDREIAQACLATITPDICSDAFRSVWTPTNRRLAVIGHYPVPLTEQEMRAAYEESAYARFFREQDTRAIGTFDYTNFGAAGVEIQRTHEPRTDIHSVAFANGIRLNLKQTDYEKGHVYLRLRLGRGLASEPADKPGLGLIAGNSFLAGGLGHYDNTELGRRLAADTLSLNFSVEEEACYFTGFASPEKLEKLLQVVTAFFTDPAFRPEGWQSTVSRLQSYYPTVNREPVQFLRAICPTIMASGDPRFGLVLPALLQNRQPREVEDWLRGELASAALEIGLAGDLEVEPAIAAVARTLATLPPRAKAAKLDLARRPLLPAPPLQQTWRLEGCEPDKAAVRVYWPGVDGDDYHSIRQLQVLAEILNDRLRVKIREELGATYGPQQDVWGSEIWPGYGYFYVEIETAPKMAEKVANLTRSIAADIASKGVTEDEFLRVIEPRLATLRQELRSNGYWTHHVLARMQETPSRVEWPLTRDQDYRTLTRADLAQTARTFLGGNRVYTFIAKP